MDKKDMEEMILKILNGDSSSWLHLMDHDRKRIAKRIAETLDTGGIE